MSLPHALHPLFEQRRTPAVDGGRGVDELVERTLRITAFDEPLDAASGVRGHDRLRERSPREALDGLAVEVDDQFVEHSCGDGVLEPEELNAFIVDGVVHECPQQFASTQFVVCCVDDATEPLDALRAAESVGHPQEMHPIGVLGDVRQDGFQEKDSLLFVEHRDGDLRIFHERIEEGVDVYFFLFVFYFLTHVALPIVRS